MVDKRLRTPFNGQERISSEEPSLRNLSDASLERLCATKDAPAWLVVPATAVEDSQTTMTRWSPSSWTAPAPTYAFEWDGERLTWTETEDNVVLPCGS